MSYTTTSSPVNDLVECPYNKAHQILRTRFQTHLIKCRKSYVGTNKVICPFNSTHLVNQPELKHHVLVCPSKASIINHQNVINSKPVGEPIVTTSDNPKPPVLFEEIVTEDWSDDVSTTYDPQKYAENANIIRNKIGAQPAERKAFRRAERARLQDIENGN